MCKCAAVYVFVWMFILLYFTCCLLLHERLQWRILYNSSIENVRSAFSIRKLAKKDLADWEKLSILMPFQIDISKQTERGVNRTVIFVSLKDIIRFMQRETVYKEVFKKKIFLYIYAHKHAYSHTNTCANTWMHIYIQANIFKQTCILIHFIYTHIQSVVLVIFMYSQLEEL